VQTHHSPARSHLSLQALGPPLLLLLLYPNLLLLLL
jgi:hypothetical protein